MYLLESQIQSVVALVLCVTSSILVIIQLIYTSKNLLFFVIILLPVAGNILILFFKVCLKVLRPSSFKFKDLKINNGYKMFDILKGQAFFCLTIHIYSKICRNFELFLRSRVWSPVKNIFVLPIISFSSILA